MASVAGSDVFNALARGEGVLELGRGSSKRQIQEYGKVGQRKWCDQIPYSSMARLGIWFRKWTLLHGRCHDSPERCVRA